MSGTEIKRIYNKISKNKEEWDYYSHDIKIPNIMDTDGCFRFIKEYIECSEKSDSDLFKDISNLRVKSPNRLSHIVSTFFIGLWVFNRSEHIKGLIVEELKKLRHFGHDDDNRICKEFKFVWFLASLFHDLGYKSEDESAQLPNYDVPFVNSVPDFYQKVYKDYYEYRKNKEHGIYAGLIFDRDTCKIRERQNNSESRLYWGEALNELYHYVAWIILSHNIWMIKKGSGDEQEYRRHNLDSLIINPGEFKIKFNEYPLFSFFCIIDTIEPIKSTSCLSYFDVKGKSLKITSNDSAYLEKILGLNDWLVPVWKENDTVIVNLDEFQPTTEEGINQ